MLLYMIIIVLSTNEEFQLVLAMRTHQLVPCPSISIYIYMNHKIQQTPLLSFLQHWTL